MFGFFKTQKNLDAEKAYYLYETAMTQSRQKEWYLNYGVPDDLDSRIELLIMHIFLWLYHLKTCEENRNIAKELNSQMVADIDASYREDGIGDQGVAKRIAKLVEHFYGLCEKYEQSFKTNDMELLKETIHKNIYGGHHHKNASPDFWVHYMQMQIEALNAQEKNGVALTMRHFVEEKE